MIPDDKIECYLSVLFGQSEPGQVMHHMLVVTAEKSDIDVYGLPKPDRLKVTLMAIDPVGDYETSKRFIYQAIVAAGIKPRSLDETVYFAGFAQEVHIVDMGKTRDSHAAQLLASSGKLEEHPDAVEKTLLYAVARDGRRWLGEHTLTGPQAGMIDGPTMITGPLRKEEQTTAFRLIRSVVNPAHEQR